MKLYDKIIFWSCCILFCYPQSHICLRWRKLIIPVYIYTRTNRRCANLPEMSIVHEGAWQYLEIERNLFLKAHHYIIMSLPTIQRYCTNVVFFSNSSCIQVSTKVPGEILTDIAKPKCLLLSTTSNVYGHVRML